MIPENLKILRDRITAKCLDVNRDPAGIKLIAVSKNFWIPEIESAFNEGIRDFGENKAQELSAKHEQLGSKVLWHFIGHLQRNKVRHVVKTADYIHSVDSLMLASEINRIAERAEKIQKILLQVKTSSEETKSGIESESELFDLAFYCSEFKNLELLGLMTMAPFTEDEQPIRDSFRKLKKLKEKLSNKGLDLPELSMGMTSDFEIAIEEGATMLRIGSAIFGERDYSKDWKET